MRNPESKRVISFIKDHFYKELSDRHRLRAIENDTGISYTILRNLSAGNQSLDNVLNEFISIYGLNPDWMLKGKGKEISGKPKETRSSTIDNITLAHDKYEILADRLMSLLEKIEESRDEERQLMRSMADINREMVSYLQKIKA